MQITCRYCGEKNKISSDNVYGTHKIKFSCSACGKTNLLTRPEGKELGRSQETFSEQKSEASSSSGREGAEIFPPAASVAFVYILERQWRESAQKALKEMGYELSTAQNISQAVIKLQLNLYELILLEDIPETNPILKEIASWPGKQRRKVNCVSVGDRGLSFDPYRAFLLGVNDYFSRSDAQSAKDLLEQSQKKFFQYNEIWQLAKKEESNPLASLS